MTVAVLGTGLIGGSIGLALTKAGISVRGYDADPDVAARAQALGAIESVAASPSAAVAGADVVIVAVPVGKVAALVVEALDAGAPAVTDVGSVKAAVIAAVRSAAHRSCARGSSAVTRWRVPNRTGSTAPTRTCSPAPPGCSPRPSTPMPPRTPRFAASSAGWAPR